MRAIAIEGFGGRDRLQLVDAPDPKLGPDGVLIAVRAAGVNPVDAKLREGRLDDRFPHRFPVIPGWDAAGVVEAVGPAVVDLEPGEEVYAYCRKSEVAEGTYAEKVAVAAGAVARKPRTASWAEAAALPLAGLTAYQVIHEGLRLERHHRVLISAAAGGVGHLAVQLAADLGAEVIGTASARNHAFVTDLGADHLVDYTAGSVGEAVHELFADGIDAYFDVLGGDALADARAAVRPGGRVTSIAQPRPEGDQPGVEGRYIFVRPSATELDELARLFDERRLRVEIAETFPLARAADAHELLEGGHVRGKLVLEIA
jgi:NADPH:quinone reductase-like Zn-dependent oxidoreductase